MSNKYNFVLLDCAPGFDVEAIAAMHVAGGLLIVSNPDYPSIAAAARAIEYAKALRVPLGGLVLNKVENRKHELKSDDIEDSLKVKILQKIHYDRKVSESIASRTPIVFLRPGNKVSVAYKKLAGSLIGEKYNDNLLRRILGY